MGRAKRHTVNTFQYVGSTLTLTSSIKIMSCVHVLLTHGLNGARCAAVTLHAKV